MTHAVQRARGLIHVPILGSRDEEAGHGQFLAREDVEVASRMLLPRAAGGRDAVPVQAALEAGAAEFLHVHGELGVREPALAAGLHVRGFRGGHAAGNGVAHAAFEWHYVVGW